MARMFWSRVSKHASLRPSPVSFVGVLAASLLSACGGGSSGNSVPTPVPAGSYDLKTAFTALATNGLSSNVSLSGTVIVNGASTSFTGTGTLTLDPDTSGTFNGTTAQLQTESISGSITVAGQSAPISTSIVNAFEPGTGAIAGQSQSNEYDVALAPIAIPSTVGTSAIALGTLNRYTDSTLSVSLGTVQLSVSVTSVPVDPGSPEVVQLTYKIYDTSGSLVETDTYNYNLTESSSVSFNSAATQSAAGTLTVLAQ